MKAVNLYLPANQALNAGSLALYLLQHVEGVFDVPLTFIERGRGGAVLAVLSDDWPYVAAQILQDSALYALKEENEKALRALAVSAPTDIRGLRYGVPSAQSHHLS